MTNENLSDQTVATVNIDGILYYIFSYNEKPYGGFHYVIDATSLPS
jgi:hypothetical protein